MRRPDFRIKRDTFLTPFLCQFVKVSTEDERLINMIFMKKLVLLLAMCVISSFANSILYAHGNDAYIGQSVKIFKAGAFNLDQDKLVRNLERNVSSWAEYYVKSKNRKMFFEAYGEMIVAINEGRISRNYDRSLRDNKGRIRNKQNGFDGMAYVVNFVNTIIDNMIQNGSYID